MLTPHLSLIIGYPVVVVGLSDCTLAFHLVALLVSSQRKKMHYTEIVHGLASHLQSGKEKIVGKALGDADDAQFKIFDKFTWKC
jgi:hypothetical protein